MALISDPFIIYSEGRGAQYRIPGRHRIPDSNIDHFRVRQISDRPCARIGTSDGPSRQLAVPDQIIG